MDKRRRQRLALALGATAAAAGAAYLIYKLLTDDGAENEDQTEKICAGTAGHSSIVDGDARGRPGTGSGGAGMEGSEARAAVSPDGQLKAHRGISTNCTARIPAFVDA
jgi:hypothetical protein